MRPKVVLPALALAGIILAGAIFLRNRPTSQAPDNQPVAEAPAVVNNNSAVTATTQPALSTSAPAPRPKAYTASREDDYIPAADTSGIDPAAHNPQEDALRTEALLTSLGSSGDSHALKQILPDLNDPNPDIRKAALNATLQLDNPDAIPALQNQMSYTDNLEEKLALQKAIEFLQLPRLQ